MKFTNGFLKNKTMNAIKNYATGWFGRPSTELHKAAATMVHVIADGKPICGYAPHKTMAFQFCSNGINYQYTECPACKLSARKILAA